MSAKSTVASRPIGASAPRPAIIALTIVNNFRANGRYTFNSSAPFTGSPASQVPVSRFASMKEKRV